MNERVTKAVILAAGRGRRMRELTDSLPKPMVEIGARPILAYIVEGLREAGVRKLLVIIGYRKEVVVNHFGDGSTFGVEIIYQEQITQDGTGKVVALGNEFCGVVNRFNEFGLPCHFPKGAFYAFPCIAPTGLKSKEFSLQLLKSKRVAVVPGSAFGASGEGYVRCCFATAMDKLKEAMDRIEHFVGELRRP